MIVAPSEIIYRVSICDDEALHRNILCEILLNYSMNTNREFQLLEYESPKLLLESKQQCDIIFLDIGFPDGEHGIETAKELRLAGVQSIIIFLTSYPQYALEGYESDAFRYLLKPITLETATKVLDAVFAKWEQKPAFISIKIIGGTNLLDSSRIKMIVAEDGKQKILYDHDTIETREPLKDIIQRLPDWAFAFAHQGCIVNLEQVKQIVGDAIIMLDGTRVTLARRQKKVFIHSIDKMIEHSK